MSPFLWFAIILTIGYIIYYTVMIMNDLYGKKPEEQNDTEQIDVPVVEGEAPPDEVPIAVVESASGFNIGEQAYDAAPVDEEQDEVTDEQPDFEDPPREEDKPTAAENLQQVQEARCESILPNWDNMMYQDDYREIVLNDGESKIGSPKVITIPVLDEI